MFEGKREMWFLGASEKIPGCGVGGNRKERVKRKEFREPAPQGYQPPVPTKAPLVYARACW